MERIISKKIIFIILILVQFLLYSDESSEIFLNELNNPIYIAGNSEYLYVSDNSQIKMYSAKNFKIVNIFGRRGEGPGEFKAGVFPQILSDSIMVSSAFKVCFFDFKGKFIRELKTNLMSSYVRKLKDKFITDSIKKEEDFYIYYNIYSNDFKKEKSFYKKKWSIHKDRKRDLFETYFFDVSKDYIIFAYGEGFIVGIVNRNGKTVKLIKRNPKKIPFEEKNWNQIFANIGSNPQTRSFDESLKRNAIRPKFFPEIRTCCIDDNKIYIFTYLKKSNLTECFVYSTEGKYLKRLFVPFKDSSILHIHPFTIMNSKIYQLVENVDKETWQLFIDKIE